MINVQQHSTFAHVMLSRTQNDNVHCYWFALCAPCPERNIGAAALVISNPMIHLLGASSLE